MRSWRTRSSDGLQSDRESLRQKPDQNWTILFLAPKAPTRVGRALLDRKVEKSEEEWKKELTPEQYKVLRKKGTERPFTGELLHNKEKGMYVCAGCGAELFDSDTKYDSGS